MGLSNEVNRTQSEGHPLASQFVVAPFIRLKCVTFMFLHRQHPMKGWLAHSWDAHTQRHGASRCKAEPLSSEALLPGLPLTIADKGYPGIGALDTGANIRNMRTSREIHDIW